MGIPKRSAHSFVLIKIDLATFTPKYATKKYLREEESEKICFTNDTEKVKEMKRHYIKPAAQIGNRMKNSSVTMPR